MRLTEQLIKNKKFDKKNCKIYDGDGLYLKIAKNGNKFFYFRYTINYRERHMSLGRYPNLSLLEARKRCIELRYKIFKGIDPLEERKTKFSSYKVKEEDFATIAREWYELNRLKWKNRKHIQQTISSLENHIFPFIGDSPLSKISTPQLLPIISALEDKPETASRVKHRLKAIFDYALHSGKISINPALHLPNIKRQAKNYPSLPYQELGDFLRRLDGYNNQKVVLALRLLVLTFVRSGELRFGKWEEIRGNEWHIPADRMKMKRPHIVPLSDWALETLEALKTLKTDDSPYFVIGSRKQPLSDMTLSMAMKRLGYAGKAVPHGFRATASSCLNESGLFNPDAIERQLAHIDQNKVRNAYNRADYMEERHRMMQWYSDFIKNIY